MAKREVPLDYLGQYLPEGTSEQVMFYLQQYKIHLTIARQRQSILGDYRHRTAFQNHRISVNGNLNKYAFLITLLHEIAHLLAFENFGNKIQAHGAEWKKVYSNLLSKFMHHPANGVSVFPADIEKELLNTLNNPAASSCAEEGLMRVLRRYDNRTEGVHLLEELPAGALFKIKGGRIFQKGEKLRKRYKCKEVSTGKFYLFSPLFEAALLSA